MYKSVSSHSAPFFLPGRKRHMTSGSAASPPPLYKDTCQHTNKQTNAILRPSLALVFQAGKRYMTWDRHLSLSLFHIHTYTHTHTKSFLPRARFRRWASAT